MPVSDGNVGTVSVEGEQCPKYRSAVSGVDNPVWIPALRAACWDGYYNETT